MPWIRNRSGKLHQVSSECAKEMIALDGAVIVPDPTIKDPREIDPREPQGQKEGILNISKLREEFEAKYGKPVPAPFKNNSIWLMSKVK
jgi:hypothetical protein